MNALVKLVLELGPLVSFFASYYKYGVYWATGIFMAATLIAAVISYLMTKKISPLMIFSGVVVMIFGGLTIWLEDQTFIQYKPTVYYLAVSAILLAGRLAGRLLLKDVMELAIQMTDDGWKELTLRVVFFYIVMAAANVGVVHYYTFETWLWIKVWVFIPVNFLFFMSQVPFMLKHEIKTPDSEPAA